MIFLTHLHVLCMFGTRNVNAATDTVTCMTCGSHRVALHRHKDTKEGQKSLKGDTRSQFDDGQH
jgi:DNA-directed RNA polymerase subunit RPC12/RpoP